jgi:hypothetical protein
LQWGTGSQTSVLSVGKGEGIMEQTQTEISKNRILHKLSSRMNLFGKILIVLGVLYVIGGLVTIKDNYGNILQVSTEYFDYDGSSLIFELNNPINSIVSVDINGLQEEEGSGYDIDGIRNIKLLSAPYLGSRIGVTYLF